MELKIIGRIDKADFPELFLTNIDVKIDTGAYTSTIHSHEIEEIELDGIPHITFKLLDPTHPDFNNRAFSTSHFTKKIVKSSNGESEERYLVQTIIHIFNTNYPIELTLSERGEMKYPILLGRKLLNGIFLVDPSKKNLSYKLKLKGK